MSLGAAQGLITSHLKRVTRVVDSGDQREWAASAPQAWKQLNLLSKDEDPQKQRR